MIAQLPLAGVQSTALQFRYLFVTDAQGLEVIDVTRVDSPRLVPHNSIPIHDAHRVYVARTYAYVAAGAEGLVIVNVERPEAMAELSSASTRAASSATAATSSSARPTRRCSPMLRTAGAVSRSSS